MTKRQKALLDYHRDVAAFTTSAKAPVFVILDLDDPVGFEIASIYQPNCAAKRDAIKETGAYPAFTLAMPITTANALLAHGWPNAKRIGAIPEGMVSVILISEGSWRRKPSRRRVGDGRGRSDLGIAPQSLINRIVSCFTAAIIFVARTSARWLLTTKRACTTPGIQKHSVRIRFRTA